ncbi:hypothetical protein DFH07DRAFT_866376 [Mycena maculata]|uniref:Uncharacterized protein n=1 Tax=Mycena maculata TaxID=230809 RepID=A0AAD7JT34_9AGAR|nr:hypothetical protein DFH07DRAFT_866376 [Mycena maculata]
MADWPDSVLRRFRAVPLNPRENDFYGPWNKLLSCLFPPASDFMVAPQSYLLSTSGGTADFVVEYEILYNSVPVLIPATPSAREEVDVHIRRRIRDLSEDCVLPTLHAVSAFGTKLAFYSTAKGHQIVPDPIPQDPTLLADTAPLRWWICDVLQDEGRQRFSSMVNEIKQVCENLEQSEDVWSGHVGE